jgi:hypothetical protein
VKVLGFCYLFMDAHFVYTTHIVDE